MQISSVEPRDKQTERDKDLTTVQVLISQMEERAKLAVSLLIWHVKKILKDEWTEKYAYKTNVPDMQQVRRPREKWQH
jgi:hypothetical protein